MLCKRGLCRHVVSVYLSVCLSRSYILSKTNKDIFEIVSPSGSQAILVFPHQTAWQYFDGIAGGEGRNWDFSQYLASLHAVNAATASCYQRDCRPIPGYRSMPAGSSTDSGPSSSVSQLRCMLVYGTESHAPVNTTKRREQFNVRSNKSNATV